MIPKECKRRADVDFPIATVSRHFTRGESINNSTRIGGHEVKKVERDWVELDAMTPR